jgi:hypothetical protein
MLLIIFEVKLRHNEVIEMSGFYVWCDACNKQHESRETCPKGWIISIWENKYISPEENKKQIENLKVSMDEDK